MNCYKFPTRAKFRSLAAAEGLLNEDDELILTTHNYAIDEVGVISKGGKYDPETGEVITPPVTLPGYHVNVIGDLAPEAWDRYLVVVNHPARVFFGGPTQAPDTPILEAML
jgi:hypothetical protein